MMDHDYITLVLASLLSAWFAVGGIIIYLMFKR